MKLGVSDSFRGRADSAAYWEAWCGAVLSRANLHTHHYPFPGGDFGSDGEYGHTWDLNVSNTAYPWGNQHPVEVKSVNLTFTNASDYPCDSVIVCSQNSFLRKWPGSSSVGRDFLFVSRITGNIVWLPSASKISVGHETMDRSRGELYKTVHAKKSDLHDLSEFVEKVRGS